MPIHLPHDQNDQLHYNLVQSRDEIDERTSLASQTSDNNTNRNGEDNESQEIGLVRRLGSLWLLVSSVSFYGRVVADDSSGCFVLLSPHYFVWEEERGFVAGQSHVVLVGQFFDDYNLGFSLKKRTYS